MMKYRKTEYESKDLSGESDFWNGYYQIVINKGLPEKTANWYVNWMKQFARFLRDTPLKQCSA